MNLLFKMVQGPHYKRCNDGTGDDERTALKMVQRARDRMHLRQCKGRTAYRRGKDRTEDDARTAQNTMQGPHQRWCKGRIKDDANPLKVVNFFCDYKIIASGGKNLDVAGHRNLCRGVFSFDRCSGELTLAGRMDAFDVQRVQTLRTSLPYIVN